MLLEEFPFESGFRLTDGDLLNKVAAEPAYSVDNAVTATGSAQATAYNVRATTTILTGGADQTGIRLPPPKVGRVLFVWNYTASGKKVYPFDSETINGAATADVPFSQGLMLICTGPTSWSATQATTSTTGDVILDASDADTATSQGHLVQLQGGAGGTTSGAGGSVSISGGPGIGTTSGDGGGISLVAGDSTAGTGGSISLQGGTPTGTISLGTDRTDLTAPTKSSGAITLATGQVNNAASGAIALTTGTSGGTGVSGPINLTTGNTPGSTAGPITLTAGTPGGKIVLVSPGGPVSLSSGLVLGTGANSTYTVTPGPTANDPATIATSGTGGVVFNTPLVNVGLPGTNNVITLTPGVAGANTATLGTSGAGGLTVTGPVTFNNALTFAASPFLVGSATNNRYSIAPGAATTNPVVLSATGTGGIQFNSNVGFNSTAPVAKPTVSGAKGSNAALASLMTALVAYGLVTDTTTA